jgi:hypothetical protein
MTDRSLSRPGVRTDGRWHAISGLFHVGVPVEALTVDGPIVEIGRFEKRSPGKPVPKLVEHHQLGGRDIKRRRQAADVD